MSTLTIIYFLALIIVSAIGMVRYKKLTIPFKVLTYSIVLTLLLEILSEFLAIKYRNNMPAFHIESTLQCCFYCLTYYYLFKNKLLRKLVLISIILIILFSAVNANFFQPFHNKYPTNVYLVTNSLLVVYSLLLFKQMLQYPLSVNIKKQSIFWFNITIIFCSTTAFLNAGLLNYYTEHHWGKDVLYYLWFGNVYIFNAFSCISLLTDNKVAQVQYE